MSEYSFERVEDILISAGRKAAQVTKEMAGTAKGKIDIKSKEYDLRQAYAALGRQYMDDHREDAEFAYDKMQEILDLEQEIADLKDASAKSKTTEDDDTVDSEFVDEDEE